MKPETSHISYNISEFRTIGILNEEHAIYLVSHIPTNTTYVKKILSVYNRDVYEQLLLHPVPGTPQILCMFESPDTLTIIEEFIDGVTLSEMLDQNISFSAARIKQIILALCDILIALHACKPAIIHRDIKPSNVMITPEQKVVLIDFNAAKHQKPDSPSDTRLLGTQGYAAPEQFGFGSSQTQTDIYALGMLMNTLIYGSLDTVADPPTVFSPIILRCTQLRKEDRYPSMKSLRRALRFLRCTVTSEVFPSSPGEIAPKRVPLPWLPPGFRKKKLLNMSCMSFVYGLIFWVSLTLKTQNQISPLITWYERIFVLFLLLTGVFFAGNYLGIHRLFPRIQVYNPLLKILIITIYTFLLMAAIFFLMLALEVLLFSSQ